LDHWLELLLIVIIAVAPLVFIATSRGVISFPCSKKWHFPYGLQRWALHNKYKQHGDESGYGYNSSGGHLVPGTDAHAATQEPKQVPKGSMLSGSMDGLTAHTMVPGDDRRNQPSESVPLGSYAPGLNGSIGVNRFKTFENHYLKWGPLESVLIDFLVIALTGLVCGVLAYWAVFFFMTNVELLQGSSPYVFPICLPLLPICPGISNAGLWKVSCKVSESEGLLDALITSVWNPECYCYSSLWSLWGALTFTCLWGHWWFFLHRRVVYMENEATTAAGMVYSQLEQSGVNQGVPNRGLGDR